MDGDMPCQGRVPVSATIARMRLLEGTPHAKPIANRPATKVCVRLLGPYALNCSRRWPHGYRPQRHR
jgi:hypothetical protein